ncbi:MmgE/PrpD family protein [Comamonas sp. Y33R10-2]|nr:MmgE/PrpD family protein [Comamonas sp. Y33R10-2]
MSQRPPDAPDAIVALADYCLSTQYADLPDQVVEATKNQILDTLGVAIAGVNEGGVKELRELALEMGGKPEALLWGSRQRIPAHEAVKVNATMSHALDYDDMYDKSFMHPGVVTVPAALAVADMLGRQVSGKEIITAVALGVDISCRLADSSQPGVNGFKVGWHNTTLYGYFASAFVAGKLMGLTRDQMVSAAGIAFHQAAGNAQAHVDGALTKRMGPGFASYTGVYSARLAQKGVNGAHRVLEGVRGFYHQYHQNHYSRALLLDGLGKVFAGSQLTFKPWPSCRGSHGAVDAALGLFREHKISAADVASITIYNGPDDFQLLGTPLEKKQKPASTVEAQFSNPWVVAVALLDQQVGLRHFTPEALRRSDVLAVTQKIKTEIDTSLVKPEGGPSGTRVEVRLNNGKVYSKTVDFARGAPRNPMSRDEFLQKFMDCTLAGGMKKADAERLMQQVLSLESAADARALMTGAAVS